MNQEEKLAQIVDCEGYNYSTRKQALDKIKDKRLLNRLAETVSDVWIRLESAALSKNRHVLKELVNHSNEQIQLEAAIELNDQEALSVIVIKSGEPLHRDIALNYITDKRILKKIIKQSKMGKEKAITAIRLGDRRITKKIMSEIEDEELKLRMAQSINDINILSEISSNATDKRIRQLAGDWVYGFKPESDID